MRQRRRIELELSERQRAVIGPRESKPEGSRDWCWQTLDLLKTRWDRKDLTEQLWEETMGELEAVEAWRVIPPGYPSLDALLIAEIGKTRWEAKRELIKDPVERGKMGGRGNKAGNNITSFRGTDPAYLTARIACDHPKIYAKLQAGEFKSVRAAAKEAGIVKEPTAFERFQRIWRTASE